MANFNFNTQPEYTLNTLLATEMINLYGILCKFLIPEEINQDVNIFGDFSHLKTTDDNVFEIYMLPENTEDWDAEGYNFDPFGATNFENITLFAAKSSFSDSVGEDWKLIFGCLLILPNQKIMEITDVDPTVPGVNNLFTYNDAKSIYKLTLKPYGVKLISELDNVNIAVDEEVPYEGLDVYFNELINVKEEQDIATNVTEEVPSVDDSGTEDEIVQKPIIDTEETSPWGNYD